MAGTLADMKARIALELQRPDLTTEIGQAITDAIYAYQGERFRFVETTLDGSPTFNTVVGRATYTSADNANIGSLFAIDFLTFTDTSSTRFVITRDRPLAIKIGNQNPIMQGLPEAYAYRGNAITLYPVPNQIWTVAIDGHDKIAEPASDAEVGNPWMVEAERLVRSRAKYILAVHRTRNTKLAQAMSPDTPAENGGVMGESYRLLCEMKGHANRARGTGKIAAMQF